MSASTRLKVMSAIERCRTAALGGHVARCENAACGHTVDRVQLLPQPALPEVPGRGGAPMAGRPRSRAAAGALLPRRLHAAERAARHRLPEQARGLRPPDEGGGRDDARHRRRSQAPRRADRYHGRAAHLGLGAHPSSARAYDRAGRRALARRRAMGRRRAPTSSCMSTCWRACSAARCWRCSSMRTPPAS